MRPISPQIVAAAHWIGAKNISAGFQRELKFAYLGRHFLPLIPRPKEYDPNGTAPILDCSLVTKESWMSAHLGTHVRREDHSKHRSRKKIRQSGETMSQNAKHLSDRVAITGNPWFAAIIPSQSALIILGVVLAFILPLVVIAYVAGLEKDPPTHFFEEYQAVTFFSALFMAATALTSFVIAWIYARLNQRNLLTNFWWLSGCGFLYLGMDDYFQAHEGIDKAVLKLLGTDPENYRLDGVVIGCFGLIALVVCWRFRHEVIKFPKFVFFLYVAAGCVAGTVLSDLIEPLLGHDLSVPIEESFKVLGTAVLLAGYQTVLFDLLRRHIPIAGQIRQHAC